MSMSSYGPEYLDAGGPGGAPAGDTSDTRKRLIALGGVVGVGVVIAGGAWAATSFFATGAQPAEALPASTVAYLSVDLDPSGAQKVEAIKTLRKFPAFTEELDLDADDDLRQRMFEELTASGECEGLDFAEDVEPWLGSRAAVAAVDTGQEQPAPVLVVQVTDSAEAEEGIAHLLETCGAVADPEPDDPDGWVVAGDWVVVAESGEVAQKVVDATEKADLASDESFTRWTGEAGDDGIMSMYVSGKVADYADQIWSATDNPFESGALSEEDLYGDDFSSENYLDDEPSEMPAELQQVLEDFEGAAATLRFDDGGLELELAASNYNEDMTRFFDSDAGVDLVSSLPAGSVAAFGFGLEEGWADALMDYMASSMPEGEDMDDLVAEAEAETGLTLPDDLETLLGDGVAIAVGEGIDPDAISNGGPEEMPIGLKIAGDADDIQGVLDKLEGIDPELGSYLEVESGDGFAVISPHDGFEAQLADKGSLGDSEAFKEVVEDGDAQALMFVDFDADDEWLLRMAGDDQEARDNLEPLSAVGLSSWVDGDVAHSLFKLTTD